MTDGLEFIVKMNELVRVKVKVKVKVKVETLLTNSCLLTDERPLEP